MTFMVVNTDSHDILLGLDLLIKVGAIVDVEQGLIQIKHGPGADVEVLPLTMGTNERRGVQESESDSDSNESSDEGILLVGPDEGVFDFGNIEFEDLVRKEGLQ
ncbi:unnamed protein product [Sphagnum tenellum]